MQRFGSKDASLADVRALTVCLLGFAAFLQFDEPSKLKLCDITIYSDHMELFIESSKTDQLRQGARVIAARTNTELYPVAMLERYMSMANVICDGTDSFFLEGLSALRMGLDYDTNEA